MLPEGVRDLEPWEALRLEEWQEVFRRTTALWGYSWVGVPVLEFLDTVLAGLLRAEDFYKTFDHRGRILALRADMTTSLARRMAAASGQGPWRFAYSGPVFRFGGPALVQGERYQSGVELFGVAEEDGEAEMLVLAAQLVEEWGLGPLRLTVGHVGVMRGLVSAAGLGVEETAELEQAVMRRDLVTVERLAGSAVRGRLLSLLPRMAGGAEVLEALAGELPTEAEQARQALVRLLAALRRWPVPLDIHLDLSLAPDFRYYSGIVFEGYLPGSGRPVLSGGRYDGLAGRFGASLPAVGFAFDLLQVAESAGAPASRAGLDRVVVGEGAEAVALALRQAGLRTEVVGAGVPWQAVLAYARERGAAAVLRRSGEGFEEVGVE